MKADLLMDGSGFAGCTIAKGITTKFKKKGLAEQRNLIGIGKNSYNYYNEDGIFFQRYTPHIFHKNSKKL